MEFTIDHNLVETIVGEECSQARTELHELGPLTAYQRSIQRHDDRLANARDAHTLACRAGCYWCCYFSVDVRPVEVFNILEFMSNNLTTEERARVKQEVDANSAVLAHLSELERARRNMKCPFLVAGHCTIYPVRPQTCRNYHATNVAGCQRSYAEPDNLDIDPEFAPYVYQSGGAHVDAYSKAMQDAGYDNDAYELNAALKAALEQTEALRTRSTSQKKVFVDLVGAPIPFQFAEE